MTYLEEESSGSSSRSSSPLTIADTALIDWCFKSENLCNRWNKWDKKIVTIIAEGSLITFSILEGLTISSLIYTLSLPFRAIPTVGIIFDIASFYCGIIPATILINANIDKTISEATEETNAIVALNQKRIRILDLAIKSRDDVDVNKIYKELTELELSEIPNKSVSTKKLSRLKLMWKDIKNVWLSPVSTSLAISGLSFTPLLFISNIFRSFTIFFPAIFLAVVDVFTNACADFIKRKHEDGHREFRRILMEMAKEKTEALKKQSKPAFKLSRRETLVIMGIGLIYGIAICGITIAVLNMFALSPLISIPVGLLAGGIFGGIAYGFYRRCQKNTIKKYQEEREWLCFLATGDSPNENSSLRKKRSPGIGINSVYRGSGMLSAILSLVTMPIIHIGGTIASVGAGLLIGVAAFIPNLFLHGFLEHENRKRKESNDELTQETKEIVQKSETQNIANVKDKFSSGATILSTLPEDFVDSHPVDSFFPDNREDELLLNDSPQLGYGMAGGPP